MLVKSQVKYIQSLGQKKVRDEEGAFIVEGPRMVRELFGLPNTRPLQIFGSGDWLEENRSWLPAGFGTGTGPADGRGGMLFTEVKTAELERISSLATPNQVVAVFAKPSFPPPAPGNSVSLLLDGVQDPGNLGTIVRIADWFGLRQVICSPDSADVFNAKAIQSTMGSISRVQVSYEDPEKLIMRHPDLPLYAAVLEGQDIYRMERISRGMIIIGNESRGIRGELLARSLHRITIPRIGQAESLNAAVATGIILSHLAPLS